MTVSTLFHVYHSDQDLERNATTLSCIIVDIFLDDNKKKDSAQTTGNVNVTILLAALLHALNGYQSHLNKQRKKAGNLLLSVTNSILIMNQ